MEPKQLFGICLFVSCVSICAFKVNQLRGTKSTATSISTHQTSDGIPCVEEAILCLKYPGNFEGKQSFLQDIHNDMALSIAMNSVQSSITVFVCMCKGQYATISSPAAESVSSSDVLAYVSAIYSKLWDEMLSQKRISTRCTVLTDFRNLDSSLVLDLSSGTHGKTVLLAPGVDSPPSPLDSTDSQLSFAMIDGAKKMKLCPYSEYVFIDYPGQQLSTYRRLAIGGTFDLLHNGHCKLLTLAAMLCEDTLVVGVTGTSMLQAKKNSGDITSFADRARGVQDFVQKLRPKLNVLIVEIKDPFGPTITDPTLDALILSSETISGAKAINDKRIEKGMKRLTCLVSRRGEAATLSSSFLRQQKFQQ
jgi:cytidyltransferase-like protein